MVAVFVLSPVLRSGYSADDLYLSQLPALFRYGHLSPWRYILNFTSDWMRLHGRFFPGAAILHVVVFDVFRTPLAYKLAQVAAAAATVLLLYVLVRVWTGSPPCAGLAALTLALSMQIRFAFDAVLQFGTLVPTVMDLLLLALLAFLLYLRSGRRELLVLASLTYLGAVISYEIAVVLFPTLLFVAASERSGWRRWRRPLLPLAVPMGTAGLMGLVLHASAKAPGPGYTSSFAPARAVPAFARQLIGGVPGAYPLVSPPSFLGPRHQGFLPTSAPAWFVAVLGGLAFAFAFASLPRVAPRVVAYLLGAGLTLWVVPASVVAQTVRWQHEIAWGSAYIPVYFEAVGVSIIGVAALWILRTWLADRGARAVVRLAALLCAISFGLLVSLTHTKNGAAITAIDSQQGPFRDTFVASVQHGLFSDIPVGGVVATEWTDWFTWINAPMIQFNGGPLVRVLQGPPGLGDLADCRVDLSSCTARHGLEWSLVVRVTKTGKVGAAVLGHIVRVDRSAQGNARVLVDNIVGYVAQEPVLRKPCATDVASMLSFPLDDSNERPDDRTHVTALRGGQSWCLWALATASPIDLYRVTVQSPSGRRAGG